MIPRQVILDELEQYRRQHSALDRALTRLTAFEAAMRVIARHELMQEFANEIMAMTAHSHQEIVDP